MGGKKLNCRCPGGSTAIVVGFLGCVLVVTGLLSGAPPAFADDSGNPDLVTGTPCMEDAAGFGLNCTANDVSVVAVTNVTVLDDGCQNQTGDTVTFSALFETLLTAQARHDVGLWFAEDGGDALNGTCTAVTPAYAPDPPFLDLDGVNDDPGGVIQDTCGDIDSTHNPLFQTFTLTVKCIDPDEDGFLNLINCSSWRQPGGNDLCTSPTQAFPGAPSKCRCDGALNVTEVPVPPLDPCADVDCSGSGDQCNDGVCVVENDLPVCVSVPKADSTPCEDGSFCTSETGTPGSPDHCEAGTCVGIPVDCGPGDQCNDGVCNVGTGVCEPIPKADSTPCEDGDVCTSETGSEGTPDHCFSGVCTGVPVDCSAEDDQCNVGVCNPGTGACEPDPVADSTPCEDGDVCTSETGSEGTPDHCFGGTCTGVPVDCSAEDDQCNVGVCNDATGACEADPVVDSTPCEDGDACTSETGDEGTPDHCFSGVCTGVPVDCSGEDDQCNVGVCNDATGACEADPVVDSTPCEDGDACTSETGDEGTPDHCFSGVCTGVPVDCSAEDDQCNVGVCNPGTGACEPDPVADSTPCEDGDVCTSETGSEGTPDHCFGGTCTGIPVDCSAEDDQCNVGVCNDATGACEADPVVDSTPCEDGDVCTSETGSEGTPDHCFSGVCTGIPVDCSGEDDQCNVGVCNPGTGACEPDPVADSTPCEDGDVCTSETGSEGTPDHCFGGTCTGIPVDCSAEDDQCNVGVCNDATGACELDPVEDSTPCDDLDACTSETGEPGTGDHCFSGVCTGIPVTVELTVFKVVQNDDQCSRGIGLDPEDFTLDISCSPTACVPGSFPGSSDLGEIFTLDQGDTYLVTEDLGELAEFYAVSYEGCDGSATCDPDTGPRDAVCTVTNDDLPQRHPGRIQVLQAPWSYVKEGDLVVELHGQINVLNISDKDKNVVLSQYKLELRIRENGEGRFQRLAILTEADCTFDPSTPYLLPGSPPGDDVDVEFWCEEDVLAELGIDVGDVLRVAARINIFGGHRQFRSSFTQMIE